MLVNFLQSLSLIDWFIIYFVLINILGIIFMAVDKNKAKKNRYRIPEKTLFAIAFIGGSLGIYMGMYWFRHKTLHKSFKYGVPTILVITYSAAVYLLFFTNIL